MNLFVNPGVIQTFQQQLHFIYTYKKIAPETDKVKIKCIT